MKLDVRAVSKCQGSYEPVMKIALFIAARETLIERVTSANYRSQSSIADGFEVTCDCQSAAILESTTAQPYSLHWQYDSLADFFETCFRKRKWRRGGIHDCYGYKQRVDVERDQVVDHQRLRGPGDCCVRHDWQVPQAQGHFSVRRTQTD